MSLRVSLASAAVLALTCVSSADAAPIGYNLLFDPTDVLIANNGGTCTGDPATNSVSGFANDACGSLTWAFTLAGYDPATDALTSGLLTLTFYDDNTPGPDEDGTHTESVNISLDGVLTSGSPVLITNGSTSGNPFTTPQFSVLTQLEADGSLTVLINLPPGHLGNNDFYFASSSLVVSGERTDQNGDDPPPGTVPEPGTFVLFSAAMGAFALRRRRAALR